MSALLQTLRSLLELFKSKTHPVARYIIGFTIWIILHRVYMKLYRIYNKLPPGPDGLPFLGSLPWILIRGSKSNQEVPNKYGKYLTYLWLGSVNVASIHNAKIAKQVFSNINCQDRTPIFYSMIANEADVLRVKYGNQWKDRRKLIRSSLLTMEDSNYVDINVSMFIEKYIDPKILSSMNENGCINAKEILLSIRHLTFSMILKVMFGKELTFKEPLFIELSKLYEAWSTDIMYANFWNLSPFLRFINGDRAIKHVQNLENALDNLIKQKFFEESINKFDENKKETYFDFAYSYINDSKSNKNNITLNQLIMDFRILIQASIDTATFVLQLGLLNLIKYPKIQNIIYNELYATFPNRIFTLKQVVKCPRFRAFVNEILRIALPVPAGVPRYNTKENINVKYTDNGGKEYQYIIPKGTTVILNLPYIHYENREKWRKSDGHHDDDDDDDEKEICLDNWLEYDDNKVTFKNRKDIFPFSVGARECVGKSLALRLLYSIFATMILKYKWEKYDDNFEIKTTFTATGGHRVDTNCNVLSKLRK